MQFTTLATSLFLGAAAAFPALPHHVPAVPRQAGCNDTIADGTPFGLMALRSASPVHFLAVDAAIGNLWLNYPDAGASCESGPATDAQFYLKEGELFLYSTENPPQKLFTDRSGMGQGAFGYVTGAQSPGARSETKTFALDEASDLTINGDSFLACPYKDQTWGVRVNVGSDAPAGQEGCLGISLRAVPATTPNSCLYTQ